jgi:hypothetical protein
MSTRTVGAALGRGGVKLGSLVVKGAVHAGYALGDLGEGVMEGGALEIERQQQLVNTLIDEKRAARLIAMANIKAALEAAKAPAAPVIESKAKLAKA